MRKKYLLVLLILPLILGMGLNFSCSSPDEKATIDQMMQMLSVVDMATSEVADYGSLALPIKTRGASSVSKASALQSINRKGFKLGLNLMGVKTAQELAEPPAPVITGPDGSGWYSLNYVYAGADAGMSINVDIKSKARLLKNSNTPVSVDISKLTGGSPTEEDLTTALDALLAGINGANSLTAVLQISGDVTSSYTDESGSDSVDLKDINVDVSATANFSAPLNTDTFDAEVTSAVLEADLGCKTVVDDQNVKLNVSYTINADITTPENSTATISYTVGTGFMYMDSYNLTATTAQGTTSGTVSHGGETVTFTITDGVGTYVYKGVTYDMSTGEPVI